MTLNVEIPDSVLLKPCITVFGIGGAGGNAVNNMIRSGLDGAKFVVANTDAQALEISLADKKIQLGENLTKGLGAGASPDVGAASAEETMPIILEQLKGSNMVFITAGMGGGTGTGAAPIIAKAAKELGVLTVGVVTKPFSFEGAHRMKIAERGLNELERYVDTLIVIPNQNLFRVANEKTTFADAFKMADDVLHDGVRGITDLMTMPGLINLDFADIKTVMSEMGKAMMGTGESSSDDNRAILAAEAAISNPLLEDCSMKGAKAVIINITGGSDMTLFQLDAAANRIREEVDENANIIVGSAFNPNLDGKIRVSVVATGIASSTKKFSNYFDTSVKQETPATDPVEELKEYANNIAEQSDEFFATPEAIEPEFKSEKQAPFNFDNSEEIEERALKRTQMSFEEEGEPVFADMIEEEAPKAKSGLGIFGRMANSMRLKSNVAPAAPKEAPKASIKANKEAKSDSPIYEQDELLDIPAFMRRNKK